VLLEVDEEAAVYGRKWGLDPTYRAAGPGRPENVVIDAQALAFESSAVVAVKSWPGNARYWFDHADYDQATDRLQLTCGPATAAAAYVTPEGHVVRVAEPGGYVCGLVLTDLRRRLARHGRVVLTLQTLERLSFSVEDVAEALTARA
jgi:hypothetical protein